LKASQCGDSRSASALIASTPITNRLILNSTLQSTARFHPIRLRCYTTVSLSFRAKLWLHNSVRIPPPETPSIVDTLTSTSDGFRPTVRTGLRQAPRYVSPEPVALDTALERVVHYAADSLWQRALRDLPSKDQEVGYRFGRQEALRVSERPGIVFIWRQAISSAGDPRGSFFFVINSRDGALVVATFGHPEWSPNSDIVQIRPYLFFKIGHDSRIFLLAQRSRAWEDYSGGWAILEASNGRVVGSSH